MRRHLCLCFEKFNIVSMHATPNNLKFLNFSSMCINHYFLFVFTEAEMTTWKFIWNKKRLQIDTPILKNKAWGMIICGFKVCCKAQPCRAVEQKRGTSNAYTHLIKLFSIRSPRIYNCYWIVSYVNGARKTYVQMKRTEIKLPSCTTN